MMQYQCTICLYVYVPELGDIEQGILPGTPFDELPDSWACPHCGVGKELFVPLR